MAAINYAGYVKPQDAVCGINRFVAGVLGAIKSVTQGSLHRGHAFRLFAICPSKDGGPSDDGLKECKNKTAAPGIDMLLVIKVPKLLLSLFGPFISYVSNLGE